MWGSYPRAGDESQPLISAPSTLALKWLVSRRDYCCEQKSPHYEPHTNSSCYEEATFAEANSDKQDYATAAARAGSPRLPSQSFATSDSATDNFFSNSGRHDSADQLMRAWASIRRGCHSQQTIPTKYDCFRIRKQDNLFGFEKHNKLVSRDVLRNAEALLFFLFRIQLLFFST